MWVNLTASQPQVCVLVRSSGSISRSSMAAVRRKHGICSTVLAAGAGWHHWQSNGGSVAATRRRRAAWWRRQQRESSIGSAAVAVTAAAVAQQRWAVGKQGYRGAATAAVEWWHSFVAVSQYMISFFVNVSMNSSNPFSPHLINEFICIKQWIHLLHESI